MAQPKQEICTIRIIFPVESDEQAIERKKKIAELFADMPEAMTDFRISSMPKPPT